MTAIVWSSLVANTVTTQTVATGASGVHVRVYNRSTSTDLFFTVDGTTPTVAGANCYMVPAGTHFTAQNETSSTTLTLKLISAGSVSYGYETNSSGVLGGPVTFALAPASTFDTSALATLAKQPGIGTAGTANADVLTVQGIASGTPQPVSGTVTITPSGTQTVTGTLTVAQPTAASLKVDLSGTAANTTALKVDGSGVTQPVSVAGTLNVNDTAGATGGYSFSNINTAATTVVKSGAGKLHTIVINTRGVATNATVYDNTAGSGTKIATIDTTLSTTSFTFDLAFATGLTVVSTAGTGAADLTVTYK